MTIQEMASNYNRAFPEYPPLVTTDRWLYGMWMIGNNYHSKRGYYGEYPPSYLQRVLAMFPGSKDILHLFSGTINGIAATTFDINPNLNPDVVGDAHHLSNYFPPKQFDLVLADPPYSSEDAEHYGTRMVNRSKVLAESAVICSGHIVWLDQVLPMYRKSELDLIGTIGLVRSTNHRFRVVCIFEVRNDHTKCHC